MIKILAYLRKKEWLSIFVSLVFIVFQVWLDLKTPEYMAEITTLLQTPGTTTGDLLIPGGYMLLCALGSMVAAMIVGYFASRVAAGLSRRLRAEVFEKTLSFSMEEINEFSTSSLITRSTNDITQIQFVIAMGLQAIVKAPIMAVWAITKIAGKSWQWTSVTAGAVLFLMALLSVVVFFVLPRFKLIQTLTDNLNRVTRENLTGLRVVRAYNAEGYQEEKFEAANEQLTSNNLVANRIMALMAPGMTFIMSGMSVAIYWIGAYLIDAAAMEQKITLFSDMVVFSSYSIQVVMSFMMLSIIFILLPRASVSANRILEVLETKVKIIDGTAVDGLPGQMGEVEFRNVSFRYPDAEEEVLHNISFKAHKGETVAFIGSTGSGKSTLINLVPRFFDATEGTILIDGRDIKEYNQKALREKVGYVSQQAVLFSGTITSNVAYGIEKMKDVLQAVKEAVRIAQGTEFVEAQDSQYAARVAQGGANFSGGQKQRLAIARAVYHDPEIYIFDDSFSALDYKTDRVLRSELKKATKEATSLIVAQRIGTIKDADRIIVLEEGRIAGVGTHEELLQSCQTYQEIAYSQLSKEELEHE